MKNSSDDAESGSGVGAASSREDILENMSVDFRILFVVEFENRPWGCGIIRMSPTVITSWYGNYGMAIPIWYGTMMQLAREQHRNTWKAPSPHTLLTCTSTVSKGS